MRKKQGITITVMVITIVILVILAGTITFAMYSTIKYSTLSAWANEILYIQDVVDEELNSTSDTDFAAGNIILDISDVVIDENQFDGETIIQDNTITLKILDLSKLGISNTNYGNLETSNDVYAFSEETGRVYYAQGIEVDGKMYYTLTENLRNRFGLNTTSNSLASVVFKPSVIGYTNQPITLTIKIPNTYTNIVISTSNDQIQIGAQVVKDKVYEYLINGNNIAGNYTVTVSYNDGTQTHTSSYEVIGYDVTAPIIQQLTSTNFLYKETSEARQEYLINLTATDDSGIKVMKYGVGTIDNDDAREYFETNKNIIKDGKINLNKTTTAYTIYVEDNAGNFSILTFDKNDYIIKEWVVATVDGVPIPRGFVASPYGEDTIKGIPAENTRAGGLVIYELTEEEIKKGATTLPENETQYTSWTTRNQYVWVPVSDLSTNEFERVDWTSVSISDTLGINYWEITPNIKNIDLTATYDNPKYKSCMDEQEYETSAKCISTYGDPTIKAGDFVTQKTINEVTEMYESVEKYGGFYIARYEAGLDLDDRKIEDDGTLITTVHSKMNKAPYSYIGWSNSKTMLVETGGAVEVARGIYPKTNKNYGVISTLTYGVQWDSAVQWLKDSGINILNSKNYGNYLNNEIPNETFNEGASISEDNGVTYTIIDSTYSKTTSQSHLYTTGATTEARVNNIYDMAGNLYEWVMEGYGANKHAVRGGRFSINGEDRSIASRGNNGPNASISFYSFRPALYIKK